MHNSLSSKNYQDECASEQEKRENPASIFDTPSQIVADRGLSIDAKLAALDNWEQDDRDLMTASDEGMREVVESRARGGDDQLDEVMRAKLRLGAGSAEKPS